MKITVYRVIGLRSRNPSVLASVDDQFEVDWNPRRGWTCTCDVEGDRCLHVDGVFDLIDPRVFSTSLSERTNA